MSKINYNLSNGMQFQLLFSQGLSKKNKQGELIVQTRAIERDKIFQLLNTIYIQKSLSRNFIFVYITTKLRMLKNYTRERENMDSTTNIEDS